jgi:hypothetical protein
MQVIPYEKWRNTQRDLPEGVCPDCDGAHYVQCGTCAGQGVQACECTNPGPLHQSRPPAADCQICAGEGWLNCGDCNGSGKRFCLECWGAGLSARSIYEAEVLALKAALSDWHIGRRCDDDDPLAGLPMGVK